MHTSRNRSQSMNNSRNCLAHLLPPAPSPALDHLFSYVSRSILCQRLKGTRRQTFQSLSLWSSLCSNILASLSSNQRQDPLASVVSLWPCTAQGLELLGGESGNLYSLPGNEAQWLCCHVMSQKNCSIYFVWFPVWLGWESKSGPCYSGWIQNSLTFHLAK